MDLNDNVFVFIEVKLNDTELPYGQRLAFERLCDATASGGKDSYLLIASHGVEDCSKDIDVAKAIVTEVRRRGTNVLLTEEQRISIASAVTAIITLRHPFGSK